ncbi:MAG: TIR domain-containing protein [Alphaproteobacteria bacterium]|nr:TIR domain-containing protein [Alphaproteobacteria bacterium]
MADIFLSYAREDAGAVERLAAALQGAGYACWWDRNLTSGSRYLKETEAELNAARAVLVVWSKASVDSNWVADEAMVGREANKLAAVTFDGSTPPLGFRQFQVTDFSHWKGTANEPQFQSLIGGLSRLAPTGPAPEGASQPKASGRSWFQKPVAVGAAALAALAVISVAAFTLTRPQGGPAHQPVSQRIAFFGFTPGNADALATDIAAAATNETFQGLLALRLEAASRADTQDVAPAQQRTRAAELGAAYALGGEVREAGGMVSINMHLEDVASRTTLWEKTVGGGAAEKVSLPVLAAGAATGVTRCVAGARPTLPRQDGDLLAQLATACATPFIAYVDALPRWRALARQAPDSAVIQASLSNSLIYYANHAGLSAPELREAWKEAATAAQRALAIEPDNGIARTVLAYDSMFEGRPLAEAGALMDAAIKDSPDDWRRGEIGANRTEFLKGVGRNAENLAAAQAAMNRDPLSPTPYIQLAEGLVFVGRGPEAGRVFEQLNARWPDAWWTMWPIYTVRYRISDIDEVLAASPPDVSEESKTCWRQLAKAFASNSPVVRRAGADIATQCGADGRIPAETADFMRRRLVGDVGEILAWYGALLDRSLPSTGFLYAGGALLDKNERALRADPKFLPLMKKSGIYQYWLDTGTHPDVCDDPAEKNFDVCASLRAVQAKK